MDDLDRRILGTVTGRGRIALTELAGELHLSASATRERLRRLEDRGLITGYQAVVEESALGFPLHALVEVDLRPEADLATFERELQERPAVVEALHATGEHDYIVRLRCRDTEELHRTVRAFKTELGAIRTRTSVVLDQAIPARPRLD
jgi:Lrp/AsnC family leucine-responsive transcriptional regulator